MAATWSPPPYSTKRYGEGLKAVATGSSSLHISLEPWVHSRSVSREIARYGPRYLMVPAVVSSNSQPLKMSQRCQRPVLAVRTEVSKIAVQR